MSRSLEALREWMGRAGQEAPFPRHPGVRVVAAGKGGVGTSTVAGLMALAAAWQGDRTLLVEMDPGSLPLLFGMDGEMAGLADLSRGGVEPSRLVRRVDERLDLLPSGGWGDPWSEGETARLLSTRALSDLYERYDTVVVDGGARAPSVMAACEGGLEHLWIITLPDRVSAAGAYALLKALSMRWPDLPVSVAVNRATSEQGARALEVIRSAVEGFLGIQARKGAWIPPDPELARCARGRLPLSALRPGPALGGAAALLPFPENGNGSHPEGSSGVSSGEPSG